VCLRAGCSQCKPSNNEIIVERKATITEPYYGRTLPSEAPKARYPVNYLRQWTYTIGSKQHQIKMEIVDEFARQGVDYWKTGIPEYTLNQIKKGNARALVCASRPRRRHFRVAPFIAALIVNILTDPQPLYRIAEFYEQQDVELLFSEDITADDLHDDTLGRALDRLFLADPKHVFNSIACGAVSRGHIKLKFVHADTTSSRVLGVCVPASLVGCRIHTDENSPHPQ
jgi:hypothetical protein